MAEIQSICIDANGEEVYKYLPQSKNPKKIIRQLFEINNYQIYSALDKKGYTEFKIHKKNIKKIKIINIYFANYKFDSQRKRWININLGTKIESPYDLMINEKEKSSTLIIGVYVFDRNDSVRDSILVNCPIKDRNYKGNPSLRVKIKVIREARLKGMYTWTNDANDKFTAFKPLEFDKILYLPTKSFSSVRSDEFKTLKIIPSNKISRGPAPRKKSYFIEQSNPSVGEAYTYVAQFGKEDIYKVGYTNNFERRVREFNAYIPKVEKKDLDTWGMIWTRKLKNRTKAYNLEQTILDNLHKYRTSKEFIVCRFDIIKNEINKL